MQDAQGAILFCEMFHDDPKLSFMIINFYELYGYIVKNMANLL